MIAKVIIDGGIEGVKWRNKRQSRDGAMVPTDCVISLCTVAMYNLNTLSENNREQRLRVLSNH